MKTPITPWIDLMLHQAQRGHHLAWFLYGWFEREQLLNLDAFFAWSARGAAAAPTCRSDGVAPVPPSATRPVGRSAPKT
jgi:hypothetical protein